MHERCSYKDLEVLELEEITGKSFAGYLRDVNDILLPIFLKPEHMANRREIICHLNELALPEVGVPEVDTPELPQPQPQANPLPKARRGRPRSKLPVEDIAVLVRKGLGAKSIAKELARKGIKVSSMTIRRHLEEKAA